MQALFKFVAMSGNSIGQLFKLSTFGESHGKAIGGIIDGFPSNFEIDFEALQHQLSRRKPGQSSISTQRSESDEVQFLSGIFENKTTGTPISFQVLNNDNQSKDYDNLKEVYRPGHADFVYQAKYGIRDHRGGGRSSARETVARVVAGQLAQQFLAKHGIEIGAYVNRVGNIATESKPKLYNISQVDQNIARCPEKETAQKMIDLIEAVKLHGDSLGGSIVCVAAGLPVGLGEPVFDKLHADLAKAMMSINAAKSFEIGDGIAGTYLLGSQLNDEFETKNNVIVTKTNHSGGIQGGISNGADVVFTVGFKPVSSILKSQNTVNIKGNETTLQVQGRHDPCVLPRAVPIVESMAALVIADQYLRWKAYR